MRCTVRYIILLFLSCKLANPPKEEHLGPFFFKDYANYFWFKPGTYWIYENNRTLELDTCTLYKIERDTITVTGITSNNAKRVHTYESINFDIYSNHRPGGRIHYTTNSPCPHCVTDDTIISIRREDNPSAVFCIPWERLGDFSKYYPTYTIASQTYYEVYRFDMILDNTLPTWDNTKLVWGTINGTSQRSSYVWAKDVGLIQIMYTGVNSSGVDTAYWSLKTYNLKHF